MLKSKKYLVISGILVAVIIIALAITLIFFSSRGENKAYTEYNPSGEITQNEDNPTIVDSSNSGENNPPIDNSDTSSTITVPAEMQAVIDSYSGSINNSDVLNQLAPSYPSKLIPIYMASSAADSADIVTDNGNPGWTAQYGSNASTDEIASFYEELMHSTSGYSVQESGSSTTIIGTVDNCNVRITISPNNPERTGLSDASNVSIYIERV